MLSRWRERGPALNVVLYGRKECCLCDDARAHLRSLQSRFRLQLDEVDVDGDPSLRVKYGYYVPVVDVGDQITLVSRVTREGLEWALRSVETNR